MDQKIDYLAELRCLAKYQSQSNCTVRYSFQIISGDDRHQLVVHPLEEQSRDDESVDPILIHSNTDPLLLWSEHNYIEILDGGISEGHGIFQLTSQATRLG